MNLLNKCFKIVEDDEELRKQFPELEVGVEFKVVAVDNDDFSPEKHGITAVQIKNGPYIHVKSRDTWFWCFYCSDTMYQLKEVEELASDFFPEAPKHLFDGKPIAERLSKLAKNSDAEYDYYEGNLLRAAVIYIEQLEKQLAFSDRAF